MIVPLATAALLLWGGTAFGQEAPHRGGQAPKDPKVQAEKRTQQMKVQLGLTDEQATKVEAINEQFGQQMLSLRQEQNDERRSRMRTATQERDAALKGVLTPEQFQKMTALREQRMEQRKEKGQPEGRPMEHKE